MIGGETRIHIVQVLNGADEEAGADHEQQAEADLQGDAGAAETERAAAAGFGLPAECLGEARIPELHRGRETEEQAGGERGGDSENEHAPVERSGERALVGGGAGHPVNEQMQSLRRDEEPEWPLRKCPGAGLP